MMVGTGCLERSCYLNEHFGKEAHKCFTLPRKHRSICVECAGTDIILNICVMSRWCRYKNTSIIFLELKGQALCFPKSVSIPCNSSETANSQTQH